MDWCVYFAVSAGGVADHVMSVGCEPASLLRLDNYSLVLGLKPNFVQYIIDVDRALINAWAWESDVWRWREFFNACVGCLRGG